jgi:hypothetical protein
MRPILAFNIYIRAKAINLYFMPVFRILTRIRIHIFLGLPDPDPLVRGMDPDLNQAPDPLSSSKNSKKNLDSYCFVTSLDFLSLKNDVNVPSKSTVISRKTFLKLVFCWRFEG